jgi:anaerobic selenocysteine-containing dehydrogenase
MFYEVPGATITTDIIFLMQTWYGPAQSYAQYTPAVVEPPPGSDVIEEWEFFYGLACRLGIQLELSDFVSSRVEPVRIDMAHKPTTDELIEVLAAGSRVPLDEVKRQPHGASFPTPESVVQPAEPGTRARLQVANPVMLAQLRDLYGPGLEALAAADVAAEPFPLRLVTRRVQDTYNSTGVEPPVGRKRPYNPAYMHPADAKRLGLSHGDAAVVRSARASIPAVVSVDSSLRPGVVAMTHGYGGAPDRDDEYESIGASTSRLLDTTDVADPYVGMPRISNIPVTVIRRATPAPPDGEGRSGSD